MKKRLLEFIFFVVLITVMVMSLNMAVADSTGMNIKSSELLKYTFLIVLTAAIFIKYPITLIAATAVAIGGGLYVYVKQLVIPSDIINYAGSFIKWLPQYVLGYEAFEMKFSLMFAILYILLTTLIISLIVFNKKGYGFLVALGTGAFTFFWFIYVSKARLYLFYYLFASLILYSYNVYDKKKLEWISAESKIDKNIEIKWVFNSLIIIFVSIIISQFAVLDIKPLQWSWLSEKTFQVFPFIENWRNDNFDNLGFGFGSTYGIDAAGYKTSRLGGPVKLSEKVMLIVETDSRENIYLRGSVKDFYSGSSWSKTKKSNVQYAADAEIPLTFSTATAYTRDIKITHQNLITSTIFAPNTLSRVQSERIKYFVDEDNEAFFSRNISKKERYTVITKIPYIDINKLKNIATASLSPDTYKQLPDNISQRVRQLALDITSGYNNDYDKAKAIEKYLRTNYKYTLTPSVVPKGSEFVDYFLFEGKEGYCVYFATAMGVLLRAVEIPNRYVEGFLAKYENSNIRNVKGTTAHSWVEVNFGDYGWITFEATPAYPLAGFSRQGEVPTSPITESDLIEPSAPIKPIDTDTRAKELEKVDEEGEGTDAEQTKEISLAIGIILTIIAILLLRSLYLLLKKAYFELKLKKASSKQYAIRYFQDILKYFKKINIMMLNEETMREYWYKVKNTLDEDYQNGDEIISLLEKLRYSQENMNDMDRSQLEEYRKKVKKFVTERLGTIKALISYYIIGL